ncbi:MAG: hypothetical protein EOO77_42470 [Oxalobacteraceae bacterium]|nr:MAG: hypothetical protein EOO77_42470 [Oxalobacteraceae bacterium]
MQGDPLGPQLNSIYAQNNALKAAFSADSEAVVLGAFESRNPGGAELTTLTSTFQVRVSVTALQAMGETTIGLFNGRALGDGFDTMTFKIVAGNEDDFMFPVDEIVLAAAIFNAESEADLYFTNHVIDLGNLVGQTNFVGSLVLTASITTTSVAVSGGYAASILLADVGDSGMPLPSGATNLSAGMGGSHADPIGASHWFQPATLPIIPDYW